MAIFKEHGGQVRMSEVLAAGVSLRVPRAVVYLVSALAFHDLTTQVPHAVWIALPRGADTPKLDHPPLSVHRFAPVAYQAGV